MISGPIHQEDVTLNVYTTSNKGPSTISKN